jgi:hypothetical protein
MATFDSLNREFRFHGVARKLYGKTAMWVYGLVSLFLFWDVFLSVAGSALHYLIEVLEMMVEHFLEAIFHLSTREAQVATAWIGLSIFSILAVILLRRTVRIVRKQAGMLKERLSMKKAGFNAFRRGKEWSKPVLYTSIVVMAFYIFFA